MTNDGLFYARGWGHSGIQTGAYESTYGEGYGWGDGFGIEVGGGRGRCYHEEV